MPSPLTHVPERLEDLPNIGKKLAADLRQLGIQRPHDLIFREPSSVFRDLVPVMGYRHDPCVLYTLMAVKHFLQTAEVHPWWKYTAEGKALLQEQSIERARIEN